MADNVLYNSTGSTTIATDDVSSVHYQRVKLVDGTLESTAAIPGDATYGLDVDVTRVSGNVATIGDVAHDTTDSGAPHKIGAQARTTNPTAVADADRVNLIADDVGRLIVTPHHCRDLVAVQSTQIVNSSSETTIISSAASTFHDLVSLVISLSSATSTTLTLKDSTGGTTRGIFYIGGYGGMVFCPSTPIPQATANNNWTITSSSATVTINIMAQYVKNV